jgi:hypothetical protein
VDSLSGLSAELQATIEDGRELVTSLQSLGGDLKEGLESADSCDDLRSAS